MVYLKIIITFLCFYLVLRVLKFLTLSLSVPVFVKFLVVGLLFFLALKALVFMLERTMPFVPSQKIEVMPKDFLLKSANVSLYPDHGPSPVLTGWLIKTLKPPVKATILYCNGNAGNKSHRLPIAHSLARRGYNVFLFDYRGYGDSNGTPSEKGLFRDGKAAFLYLTEHENIPPENIILMGRSLGCAVALKSALHQSPGALVLISPFTSAKNMARKMPLFYPLSFLMSPLFDNTEMIPQVSCPVLICHSPKDEIISFSMGEELYRSAPEPKKLIPLSGGHNVDYFEDEKFLNELDDFLTQVL